MTQPASPAAPANFDRLAPIYRALEFVAFGGDLERARFCHLDALRDCREIVVLGEGDGRCLARLVRIAPQARIHCVDASPAMLTAASRRLTPEDRRRVRFTVGDARTVAFERSRYDAVITLFFLDCFSPAEVAAIARRLGESCTPGAVWLFADFVLPPRGWQRLRAKIWLTALYTFFRWQTGLQTRALPPSETAIEQAGFHPDAVVTLQHGLLRSAVYRRNT